jgi:hypothetical protein
VSGPFWIHKGGGNFNQTHAGLKKSALNPAMKKQKDKRKKRRKNIKNQENGGFLGKFEKWGGWRQQKV